MTLIAGRHIDPGRVGYIETGFVMEQNDVRQFALRTAIRRHRIQTMSGTCVSLQIPVGIKFVNGLDTGTRKF